MSPVKVRVTPRDAFLLVLVVAMVCTMFTYQLATYSVWLREGRGHTNPALPGFLTRQLTPGDEGSKKEQWKTFGRSLNMHRTKSTGDNRSILSRLLEVEDDLLRQTHTRTVLVEGDIDQLQKEQPYIQHALQRLGHVLLPAQDFGQDDPGATVVQVNSSLVLCVGEQCESPAQPRQYSIHQKVNRIPSLSTRLTNQEKLCRTAKQVLSNKEKTTKQPCFLLPSEIGELRHTVTSSSWQAALVSGLSAPSTALSVLNLTDNTISSLRESESYVVWRIPSDPIVFPGGPLLRLHVLVASFLPLRLYLYPWLRSGPYPTEEKHHFVKTTSLDDTLEYMAETYGLASSTKWWTSLQVLVLSYLASTEMQVQTESRWEPKEQNRCSRCYLVLEADVTCSSIKYCIIVQVRNHRTEAGSGDGHIKRMTEDLVSMMLSEATVAMDVASGIEEMRQSTSNDDSKICREDVSPCLTDADLVYLLEDRRETLHRGNFVKIYPTADSFKFTPLLASLRESPYTPQRATSESVPQEIRTTTEFHSILMEMETFYNKLETGQQDLLDVSVDTDDLVRKDFTRPKDKSRKMQQLTVAGNNVRESCSNDPNDIGSLRGIYSDPQLPIAHVTQHTYHVTVEYDVILVKLWAHAKSCDCEARFDEKYGTTGPMNQTLGLGDTKVMIFVVDTSFADPNVMSTYTLYIHRMARRQPVSEFDPGLKHHVCGLKQDCSLPFSPSEPCGLHRVMSFPFWTDYRNYSFKSCSSGDESGQWILPCASCEDESSCYWQQARWQPNTCTFKPLKTDGLKQCLAGKRLLFVGDSTNRGILNYLLERLNGSLWDWDKTHSTKVYSNLNNNSTLFTFAYYPHFWLPVNHRPKFNKVIFQLIKSSLPLQNNANTVLVMGGVHWLARQHIDIIMTALRREGLSNITKIVKGIGAGFHQAVDGMRYVQKSDHQKLMQRESDIFVHAKLNNFRTVATFNMTLARYKDFLQGKCGCHFHRVTKSENGQPGNQRPLYRVEGEINAAYSEIVINEICGNV